MPINITVVYFCSANLIPPAAVPRFRRGGANPKGGASTNHFGQFPPPLKTKLHKMKKMDRAWGEGGREATGGGRGRP